MNRRVRKEGRCFNIPSHGLDLVLFGVDSFHGAVRDDDAEDLGPRYFFVTGKLLTGKFFQELNGVYAKKQRRAAEISLDSFYVGPRDFVYSVPSPPQDLHRAVRDIGRPRRERFLEIRSTPPQRGTTPKTACPRVDGGLGRSEKELVWQNGSTPS